MDADKNGGRKAGYWGDDGSLDSDDGVRDWGGWILEVLRDFWLSLAMDQIKVLRKKTAPAQYQI